MAPRRYVAFKHFVVPEPEPHSDTHRSQDCDEGNESASEGHEGGSEANHESNVCRKENNEGHEGLEVTEGYKGIDENGEGTEQERDKGEEGADDSDGIEYEGDACDDGLKENDEKRHHEDCEC